MENTENDKLNKDAETIMSLCLKFISGGITGETFKMNMDLISRMINNNLKSDYDEMFESGVKAQLERMIKYEGKKEEYKDIKLFFASMIIIDHISDLLKLSLLIDDYPEIETCINLKRLRKEAADISNYAHMIILKCDKSLK